MVVFVHHLLVVLGVCRLRSLLTVAIVVRSCLFVIAVMYWRWLDDVAHLDGPLMCHIVARVGTCGAAGVVVYCGWLGLFTGWVVFVVRQIVVIVL